MKKALTFLLVFCTIGSFAQERKVIHINNVINTVKERLTITGFLQAGYDYEDGADGQNSFNLKRADMALTAKITEHWKAMFAYAFANGSVQELWTEYEFIPQLRLKAGQFKITFGLENGITPTKAELIDDYSQVTCYMLGVRGNPLQGNHAGRDIGIVLNGDLFNNLLHYDLALMNGQGINRKDGNKHKDLVARLNVNATDWLTLSGSLYNGKNHAVGISRFVPEIQEGEDYTNNRWGIGANISVKELNLRAEYVHGKEGSAKSEGYYALAYIHVHPKVDLIFSYDYLNRNKDLGMKQTNYIAGADWWFYPGCRLRLNYTRQERSAAMGNDSNWLQAQIQVGF
ncbi:MAG: porin [Bacteroidaceae bacterium]|nr:porin [Bacteroidaceae bacterium]